MAEINIKKLQELIDNGEIANLLVSYSHAKRTIQDLVNMVNKRDKEIIRLKQR